MAGPDAKILVVEDEPDIADIYADWLRDDYDVVIASSGHRALEALDESIDVVLLDRRIPVIHGADILKRIRARDLSC
jgi:DNA-binding response OmpR family regulator